MGSDAMVIRVTLGVSFPRMATDGQGVFVVHGFDKGSTGWHGVRCH